VVRAVSLKDKSSIFRVLLLLEASLTDTSAFPFPGMFLQAGAGIHMKDTERGAREKALSCMFFITSLIVVP